MSRAFESTVRLIQDAGRKTNDWFTAIEAAVHAIGSETGQLSSFDSREFKAAHDIFVGIQNENTVQEYVSHYRDISERFDYIKSHPGIVVNEHLFIDERGMDKSEFYDWSTRNGARYTLAYYNNGVGPENWLFGVFRNDRQYTTDEKKLFSQLVPAIRSAVSVAISEKSAFDRHADLIGALEATGQPAAIIDDTFQVVLDNNCFRQFLDQQDGLAVVDANLKARSSGDQARLQTVIQSALRASRFSVGAPSHAGNVRLDGADRWSLSLIVKSLKATPGVFGHMSSWAVVLPKMVSVNGLPEERWAREFGLTKAEISIVNRLVSGESVAEIASARDVREVTVRNQLNSIFSKTNLNSQAKLIAKMGGIKAG